MVKFRFEARESGEPSSGLSASGLAFVALATTGPDPTLDHARAVQALRRAPSGEITRFQRQFSTSTEAESAWGALAEFFGGAPVVVESRESFARWDLHLRGAREPLAALGLDELTRLLLPSRAERTLAANDGDVERVVRGLADVLRRFRELPDEVRELAAAAWQVARSAASESDPENAFRLALALDVAGVASPRASADEAAELVRAEIDAVRPRCQVVGDEWRALPTIPVSREGCAPLDEVDLALVDTIFEEHVPASFARVGAASYRKGQHDVARAVARTLGTKKLLLVHAPTGTGKTLSYLVPALLWSIRNDVRVAVSTFTRALQEQASELEVPRALEMLARAGVNAAPRITVIKGRANYLCWRALRLQVPSDGDSADVWLAWTSLLLFAALDEDGDLDHFPMRAAFANDASGARQRELDSLVRAVRAQIGCCRARDDREACGAEISRQRAERSHVILVNHAFALVRPTYFKHVVFDECEHLHDQAGGAWSWSVTLREVRDFLLRLRQPGRANSRAPLDRLERFVLQDDPAWEPHQACRRHWFAALGALDEIETAVERFTRWRDGERRRREALDEHSLLREYLAAVDPSASPRLDPEVVSGARELVAAHGKLAAAATELDSALSQVASTLDTVRAEGIARIRRSLELARGDMLEWLEALRNWIPMQDGKPAFVPERFYDVEVDSRGDVVLAARVLLPNEILGRSYYPALESGVFISATTWLRGGFEVASGYLGLDRAANPLENEEREPSVVETFRAADPFDYARVLVCVADDAPDPSRNREQFQAFVRRFVAHLGERTRGRMLVLFTNADEARRTGEELTGFFRARGIPLYFQNMPGVRKEELGELFRERVDSILFGVDTFWYGADFPGETLEHLVMVKLPYGVPDRYHHAQSAALGSSEQRRRIYLPRALAKFRQGFGRLMRRETDRGCVYVLDPRVSSGAHRLFLHELPLRTDVERSPDDEWTPGGARCVAAPAERCMQAAFEHLGLLDALRDRGLNVPFESASSPALESGEL